MNVQMAIGRRVELGEFGREIFLDGRPGTVEGGVGAAEAVEGGNTGHGTEASIGVLVLAKVGVRGVISSGSHGESIQNG
jgi:hypothetical protein